MTFGKDNSAAYGTDNQVLLRIVPDFNERMEAAFKADPVFAEHVNARVHSPEGWRPLDYFKGAL